MRLLLRGGEPTVPSNWLLMNQTIVQGSGIGPVLCLIYASDLTPKCPLSIIIKYADDTVRGGKGELAFPLWVDVQKLCNMCVLSLSWNFFVSHDKYIARPSSKEPR